MVLPGWRRWRMRIRGSAARRRGRGPRDTHVWTCRVAATPHDLRHASSTRGNNSQTRRHNNLATGRIADLSHARKLYCNSGQTHVSHQKCPFSREGILTWRSLGPQCLPQTDSWSVHSFLHSASLCPADPKIFRLSLWGRYADRADNTAEENSSVFSLIWMRWLPSARACGQ